MTVPLQSPSKCRGAASVNQTSKQSTNLSIFALLNHTWIVFDKSDFHAILTILSPNPAAISHRITIQPVQFVLSLVFLLQKQPCPFRLKEESERAKQTKISACCLAPTNETLLQRQVCLLLRLLNFLCTKQSLMLLKSLWKRDVKPVLMASSMGLESQKQFCCPFPRKEEPKRRIRVVNAWGTRLGRPLVLHVRLTCSPWKCWTVSCAVSTTVRMMFSSAFRCVSRCASRSSRSSRTRSSARFWNLHEWWRRRFVLASHCFGHSKWATSNNWPTSSNHPKIYCTSGFSIVPTFVFLLCELLCEMLWWHETLNKCFFFIWDTGNKDYIIPAGNWLFLESMMSPQPCTKFCCEPFLWDWSEIFSPFLCDVGPDDFYWAA